MSPQWLQHSWVTKELSSSIRMPGFWVLASPLTTWITLGKENNVFKPRFSPQKIGIAVLWGWNDIFVAQVSAFMLHMVTIVFIHYSCGTGLFIKCFHILYFFLSLHQPSKISRIVLFLLYGWKTVAQRDTELCNTIHIPSTFSCYFFSILEV